MTAQQAGTPELAYLAAQEASMEVSRTADLAHISAHADVDEPGGTWTGGDGARYGLAIGSDATVADLMRLRGSDGRRIGFADFTWYVPEALAMVYRTYVEGMAEDARREIHQYAFGDWQHQITASWSYAWSANCKFVADVIESQARARGGAGLIVASFEHNSSQHGLARPHVHNVVALRD
jgi:hypothetical protein